MVNKEIEELIRRVKREGFTKPFIDYHNTNLIDKVYKELTSPSKVITEMCENITRASVDYLAGVMTAQQYIGFILEVRSGIEAIDSIVEEYSNGILAIREKFELEEIKELVDKSRDRFDLMFG